MPVIGETKVLPEMLAQTREKLAPAFRALLEDGTSPAG
jgi:hypothetical protein